ncbi:hypothetical protein [Caulobacter sp. UC70_42]|uniref:hypothetical protein n=1 Tax=Caulobacter sp. UC70_42 TaxID=3374551 RepID=UPI003756C1E8
MTDQLNPEDRALIELVSRWRLEASVADMTSDEPRSALFSRVASELDLLVAARLAARAEGRRSPGGEILNLAAYDAGSLSDYSGGNVSWWQDYIRAELGHAHEFYQAQVVGNWPLSSPPPSVDHIAEAGKMVPPPSVEVREAVADLIATKLRRYTMFSEDTNILDAIAHFRREKDVGKAIETIGDVASWIAEDVLALIPRRDEAALPEAVGWMAVSTAGRSKGGKKFEHRRSDAEQYGREIYTEGFEVRPVYDRAPPASARSRTAGRRGAAGEGGGTVHSVSRGLQRPELGG